MTERARSGQVEVTRKRRSRSAGAVQPRQLVKHEPHVVGPPPQSLGAGLFRRRQTRDLARLWRRPAVRHHRRVASVREDREDRVERVRDRGYDITVTCQIRELCRVGLPGFSSAVREQQRRAPSGATSKHRRVDGVRHDEPGPNAAECGTEIALQDLRGLRCGEGRPLEVGYCRRIRSLSRVPDVHHQRARAAAWRDPLLARGIRKRDRDPADFERTCRRRKRARRPRSRPANALGTQVAV